ncbi:vomeronasal type-1 receptor 3-like [Tenrec ecaudatus]|uniref:vomeronasal type-1 receptor 3-like n=1 Tax=Tenrec ecaudatus TaxID=94439 RepID=UPI003F591765
MHSRELAMAMILLAQTTLGSLGNIFLLFHYVSLSFIKYRLRSIDLIFKHLTIANVLVNLCRGIPQTMAAFGWKDFPSDVGCKLLFYVHRVGRGVSLGTTCLLSIFQVIIISPGDARWAELKVKAPKYIGFSLCLCWTLHMLANIMVAMHMTSIWGNDTITQKKPRLVDHELMCTNCFLLPYCQPLSPPQQ